MTTITLRRPLVPPARRDWQRDAICGRASLDLATVHAGSDPAVLAEARALCQSCPVLAECRATALALTDVAGFAGGMTVEQRQAWRRRRGVTVTPVSPAQVLPVGVAVHDLDLEPSTPSAGGPALPDRFLEAVGRWSRDGMSIDQITTRLDGVLVRGRPVTASTVATARAIIAGSRIRRTA